MGDESIAAGPAGLQFIIRETAGWGVAWSSPSRGKPVAVERAVGQASEMWETFLFSVRIPRRGDRFNGMASAQQGRRGAPVFRAQVMRTSWSRVCPEVEPVARGEIPDLNIVAFETRNR